MYRPTTPVVLLTFEGKVEYDFDDTVAVRNPNGSFTTFNRNQIPSYIFAEGEKLHFDFSFSQNEEAFSNSSCGGRYRLIPLAAPPSQNPCDIEARITTPFGTPTLGGSSGDSYPYLKGFEIVRNPTTGELSIDLPTGSFDFRYVGVNPYHYDSETQTLSGPTSEKCVYVYDCPTGTGTGTISQIGFLIPIAGDFGKFLLPNNVEYDAGSIGSLNIVGKFYFSSGGGTSVPAPGGMLLFGLAIAGVAARRMSTKSRHKS